MKIVCKCGYVFDCNEEDEIFFVDFKDGVIRWYCEECGQNYAVRFLPKEEKAGEMRDE